MYLNGSSPNADLQAQTVEKPVFIVVAIGHACAGMPTDSSSAALAATAAEIMGATAPGVDVGRHRNTLEGATSHKYAVRRMSRCA